MTAPIKVVYNWIGPNGPIINTELPNILSFSAVAEGATATSHKFWTEDLYWRMFAPNEKFTLASSYDIRNHEEFVFPYTLTWRIPFSTYFFSTSGILEFSHIPGRVINAIRNYKGYILLECGPEAWIEHNQLKEIHSYFTNAQVPLNKIIYLTGCMNANDAYNKWCDENNIGTAVHERISLISYPLARYHMSHMMNLQEHAEPVYRTETVPEKLFLCWNRRFRPHRSLLLLALNKAGLIERSYYSMGAVDPEFQSHSFAESVPVKVEYENPYSITSEDLNNVLNKLPLVIDGETEINEMCTNGTGRAKSFYENSLVSIVTETNWDLKLLSSTEKSFKPFAEKHPFIIVGVRGALKSMHELGFKTFDEFWDESYDEVEDPMQRLLLIIEVCKEIGTWDTEKILDFKRRSKNIIEHNYITMKNSSPKDISDQIAEVIKKQNTQ